MSRIAGLLSTLLFTLILAGCNTLTVDISVPDVITQHEPFTYEAEADPDAVGQIAYEWSLDGSIISSLPIDNALIATAGEHTLSVKITDEEGETGEAEVTLEVLPAEVLNADFAVNVELLDLEESPLESVTVTIDGVTVESDALGIAAFTGLTQTPVLTVTANKEGYIPQSYRFDLASAQESADIQLTLMACANPVVFNNDTEVTVENSDLNTSVTLPAGAFVDANGDPVTGEITATITPVDTREMGASYLGGGVALTEESEVVQLLSLGMIDFEFTQNGEAVQLAAEASAQIEMDLVAETGPDGRVYTIGEEIEMWWFDEATGLWVEEGVGEIVASASSPTGMRLIATVEHFTTWNWDYYKQGDRASFDLTCTIEGQQLTTGQNCFVRIYTNGLSRSVNVGPEGVTAINLAPSMNLTAAASYTTDDEVYYYGETSFITVPGSTSVVVNMQETVTNDLDEHTVTCYLNDGTNIWKVECRGQITTDTYYARQFSTAPDLEYSTFRLYPGEEYPILVSIQGQFIEGTVTHPTDGSKLALEYTLQSNAMEFACYGTLDGELGEFFPCQAVVTDDSGNRTSIRLGDFSGSPLSAPMSYTDGATSLDIEVVSAFTASYLNDYVSRGNQILDIISPDSGEDTLSLNTIVGNEQKIVASFDITPDQLYTYSCTYEGQSVPCYAGGTFRSPVKNAGEYAPSWMRGQLVVKSPSDLTSESVSANGSAEGIPGAGVGYYLQSESVAIDHVNRNVSFTMRLAQPDV